LERRLGRISARADVSAMAAALVGAAHMLFVGRRGDPVGRAEVEKVVRTVISGSS
jgi:hypothetical protein